MTNYRCPCPRESYSPTERYRRATVLFCERFAPGLRFVHSLCTATARTLLAGSAAHEHHIARSQKRPQAQHSLLSPETI